MPSLAELQSAFSQALRDPAVPVPRGLRGSGRSGAGRRFDVHRNNMMVSLVDALRSTFPAVHRLVGEDYFAAAARAYVMQQPPESPVLLHYGETFGDFMEALPSASGVPYLGDVARLEWARIRALHAADAEPASIDALAGIDRDLLNSVTFALHPSLSVIRSRWPVMSLRAACLDPGHSGDVDMKAPEDVVVVRPGLKVAVQAPPAGGAVFLAGLQRGAPLGAAAGHAMEATAGFDLAAQLRYVFEAGIVTAVNQPRQQDQP